MEHMILDLSVFAKCLVFVVFLAGFVALLALASRLTSENSAEDIIDIYNPFNTF